MQFSGSKKDLEKAIETNSKFKKILIALLMSGAIVGTMGDYAYALPADQKPEKTVLVRGNIDKSSTDDLLRRYNKRKELINKYKSIGYLTEEEKQAEIRRERMPGAIQKMKPVGVIQDMQMRGEIPGAKIQHTPSAEEMADREMLCNSVTKRKNFADSLKVDNSVKHKIKVDKSKKRNPNGSLSRFQDDNER